MNEKPKEKVTNFLLLLSNTVTKYPIKNETPDKNVIKYAITIKSLPCRL